MQRPRCSMKLPHSRGSISPITRSVSILIRARSAACWPRSRTGAAARDFANVRRVSFMSIVFRWILYQVSASATKRYPIPRSSMRSRGRGRDSNDQPDAGQAQVTVGRPTLVASTLTHDDQAMRVRQRQSLIGEPLDQHARLAQFFLIEWPNGEWGKFVDKVEKLDGARGIVSPQKPSVAFNHNEGRRDK